MSNKVTQKAKLKVLYQNLGGIWYAFAQNGEDVYFGRVPLNTSPEKALKLLKSQQAEAQSSATSKKDAASTAA